MGFFSSANIKSLIGKAIKDAVIPDPAKTSIANPNPSVIPKEQAPSSNVGDLYKRLSAKDVDEDKKKGMKKGGVVKSSASKRADGIATKGKTRGKMV
jgi:hypothetical protein